MGKLLDRTETAIPPLVSGDRMTTREFLRRYEAMPDGFRAELLAGVVSVNRWFETNGKSGAMMMPPISHENHGEPGFSLSHVLSTYKFATPGVRGSTPTTLLLSDTDSPEPDGLLFIGPVCGGQVALGEDGYLHGAPELVMEIANSSASYDLRTKYDQYERNGVQEYIVWQVRVGVVDWFRRNRFGKFTSLEPRESGVVCSEIFPGLWLDSASLISNNLTKVLEILQLGLASPEHAAFVAKLQAKAQRK